MRYEVKCNAESKLSDIPDRNYVANVADYKRSEFLRKQLNDEIEVSFININNVLHMVENNFIDCEETRCHLDMLSSEISALQSSFQLLFDHLSKETEL